MKKAEGNSRGFSLDPVMKSITSDLILLGNALMTRVNDPFAILEFMSFDSLQKDPVRQRVKELIDAFVSCDNDDDRLRYLLEVHHLLVESGLEHSPASKKVMKKLEALIERAIKNHGVELKKAVSEFQVEVLQIVPGISPAEYRELQKEIQALDQAADLNESINAVYEKINMHTQTPFSE